MKFDDLDKKMRVFETSHDLCVLPEVYIVARIDGRCFTKLTKDVHNFEAPYDPKFRDIMVETVKHLMQCGFKITYGYTQSDEISLLFDINDNAFQRKDPRQQDQSPQMVDSHSQTHSDVSPHFGVEDVGQE